MQERIQSIETVLHSIAGSVQAIVQRIDTQDHMIRQLSDSIGVLRQFNNVPPSASTGGVAGTASQQNTPIGRGVHISTPQAPSRVSLHVSAPSRRRELGF